MHRSLLRSLKTDFHYVAPHNKLRKLHRQGEQVMRAPHFHGNIVVSNLPGEFTASELAALFDDFGLVLGAQMDRTRAGKGSIILAPEPAVARAIEALQDRPCPGTAKAGEGRRAAGSDHRAALCRTRSNRRGDPAVSRLARRNPGRCPHPSADPLGRGRISQNPPGRDSAPNLDCCAWISPARRGKRLPL
jgi:hypothetical protein